MNDKPHLDSEALAELLEVMESDFGILISTYLSDSQERIASLDLALEGADAEAFCQAAHSFKGSCINIGAPRLGDLCMHAENAGRSGDLAAAPQLMDDIRKEFVEVSKLLRGYLKNLP